MSKDSNKAMTSSSSNNSFFNLMGFVKKPPLPEGWIVKHSTTYPDRVYFFNVRTGATTWTAPGIATSSDTGSQKSLSTFSDSSNKSSQSKTRAAHTATSQVPSNTPVSNNNRQLPLPLYPSSRSEALRVKSPSTRGRSESLGKNAGKTKPSPADALKRENLLKLSNSSRIQKPSKTRAQQDKVRLVTPSPPWGIPWKVTHPAGTLTPESLTPKSLTSPYGPDASSLSSRSSKPGSPTTPKRLQSSPTRTKSQQVRRKRSFESDSSESLALDVSAKSKHLKVTTGQKAPSDKSCSQAASGPPNAKKSIKNSIVNSVKEPQGTGPADKRDLRIQLERSKQLKKAPQEPQREQQASRSQATKLTPVPAPELPPTAKPTGKPESESPTTVTSRDSQLPSKPKKLVKSSRRRKALREAKKQSLSKQGSNICSFVKNDVSTLTANTNNDAGTSSTSWAFNQGVASFPAAEEDDEMCQMEVDLPVDTVDIGGNSDKNMGLRIVMDTNVLMHDLKFVRELLDKRIPGLGLPTIIIPWVVMQELDSLKMGSTKGGPAKNAVQFLHKCVMSEHPRVKGEPMRKSTDEADFEITCNDDWILQCCLQQQKKVGKDLAVLLTNDKHLCSKAVISSIKAFSKETLLSGLEALSGILQHRPPLPPVPTDPPGPDTPRPRTPNEPPLAADTEKELCDELISQVRETLLQGLTMVLEKEMKEAYEDLWTEIVIIKPPWSFNDVMQCYEKHWIAVFGLFLNREDKRQFQQIVELTSALQISLESLKRLINSSVYFLRRLHNQKRYGVTLEQPILRLGEIKKRCLAPLLEGRQTPNQALPSEDLSLKLSDTTEIVPIVFEAVWLKICQLSALIFEGLGVPHDLETDKTSVIPSVLECHACLGILCPLLQQIIKALDRVTQIPDRCVSGTPQPFERLCQTLQIFVREFISQDKARYAGLTTSVLQKFVVVSSHRQLLRNGIVQLANALNRLAQYQVVSS